MKITEQEVGYVAALANLHLTADEVRGLRNEMDEILAHMDKLNELDTSGVEPMAQVLLDSEQTATLRDDLERPVLGSDVALANAPLAGSGCFKVPKVIER
jgi:aspartyl-tRNA(Asn)/glutamyl-tRNA(Gln) amidotransferase subunit C